MNRSIIYCFFFLYFIFESCTGNKREPVAKKLITDYSFAGKADHFTLQKTDSCTILTISDPWQGATGVRQVFYLIGEGTGKKLRGSTESVIYVPVKKIICMSTTHLSMINALGMNDAVVGVSGGGYVYNKKLSDRIRSGIINEVGFEAGLNNEIIFKCKPDLITMYGIGSESAGYVSKIRELGFKVMFDADYLEEDPLGKAEWIRVFGALFCKEKMADSIFNSISISYNRLSEFIKQNAVTKPEVLLGMPYRDTWFVSPGNSYISHLINDAGGRYIWRDTESAYSLPYSLENVYLKALKADFWLNIGYVNSRNEIASFDKRLASIPAFIQNHLYNNNKRISPGGGNDYWESGTMNPQRILNDIASILHPGLFKGYELFYYRKVE